MGSGFVSLGVSSFSSDVFEFADVFVNVGMCHFECFEPQFHMLPSLSVLELICEFYQELIPYSRDIVCYRI